MIRRAPTLAALVALQLLATSAHAADSLDIEPVFVMACAGSQANTQSAVPSWRFAEALLLLAGHRVERLASGPLEYGSQAYQTEVLRQFDLAVDEDPQIPQAVSEAVIDRVMALGQKIRATTLKPSKPGTVRSLSEPPKQGANPFWPVIGAETAQVTCLAPEPDTDPPVWAAPTGIPVFGLVGERDALPLEGDDRKAAKAADISVERAITRKDDGTRERVTTFSINAVVGVRLSGPQAANPTFAYADYSLSRARTVPAPIVPVGQTVEDGDTNALRLGIAAPNVFRGDHFKLTIGAAMVLDFVKDSRRIEGDLALGLNPGKKADLPICGWGALNPVGGPKSIRGRCTVALEGRYSHFTTLGRVTAPAESEFLQLGGSFLWELAPPARQKQGFVSHVRFRWLETLDGTVPDIIRLESGLGYRWWLSDSVALDIGATYDRGREPKTFVDEDKLKLGLGLLF